MTLSIEHLARFGGAFDYALMADDITREELAAQLGGIHVSQFSKLKVEPDLVKVLAFGAAIGEIRAMKRAKRKGS